MVIKQYKYVLLDEKYIYIISCIPENFTALTRSLGGEKKRD